MEINKNETYEIENIDQEGNHWKISMQSVETKSNRWKLSFHFNEKEFVLSKLQTNRSAQDTWELIKKIQKESIHSKCKLPAKLSLPSSQDDKKKKTSVLLEDKTKAKEAIKKVVSAHMSSTSPSSFYAQPMKKGKGRPKKVSFKIGD